ncbi:helix-turn-helix transcriptional regulator [Streptomyces sp. NPDC002920]
MTEPIAHAHSDVGVAGSPDEIVAANVRRLRTRLGLTQVQVVERAQAAGYSFGEQAMWTLERGKRRVRVEDLYPLGLALGVRPEDLLAPGFDPDAAPTVVYEVTLDGPVVEKVKADGFDVDDQQWVHFHLSGRRVFSAPAVRVLCCRPVVGAL